MYVEVEKGGFCKETLVYGSSECAELLKDRIPHSGCMPTSPENPTHPLSLGTCCPVTGSEHPDAELRVSFQGGRRRQTPTCTVGWLWDCLHRQGSARTGRALPMLSGSNMVRYLALEEGTGTKVKNAENALKMRLPVAMAVIFLVTLHRRRRKKKRGWFKAAGGSAMGVPWPSEDMGGRQVL